MSKTREILRQKWQLGRSHREFARTLAVSPGVVGSVLVRARKTGLTTWADVEALDDSELEQRLYERKPESTRPLPDCAWIHTERRKPGVTLQLLHLEYLEQHPSGYQYTLEALNERIQELLERLNDKTMRTYGASRRELFGRLDKPHLSPLGTRFVTTSGNDARFTSTITSRLMAISIPCRMSFGSWTNIQRSGLRRQPSRSIHAASGLRLTFVVVGEAASRQPPSTCLRPIARNSNGHPHEI